MPKIIRQTRLNHWSKDERKTESQQGMLVPSYIHKASALISIIYLISLLHHPSKLLQILQLSEFKFQ